MIPLTEIRPSQKTSRAIIREVAKVVGSGRYILGDRLESFEDKFANFTGAKYAVGVGNGTDALRLSLRALGVGPGDKVLTVSLSSPFTAIAILEEGAIPVFCDVDEKTWTIDTSDLRKKMDKKVKTIVPVHLYGNPSDLESILKIADEFNLKVIEDCCQAHGAFYKRKHVGNWGEAGAFSFYPTKNLGALGDAGMIVTNNRKLAEKNKFLRHGGQTRRFWHQYPGVNSRLDEIQAAILELKLKRLPDAIKKRAKIVSIYKEGLKNLPIKFQDVLPDAISANHLMVVRAANRNRLQKYLKTKGIFTDIYYPFPIHLQPAFSKFKNGSLPVSERLARELLAIPLYPDLPLSDVRKVISAIRSYYG